MLWTCVHGFAQLANKLIAIGAKYGSVPAADVLPSVSTVSRHLADVVTTEKAKLLTRMSAVPVPRFGITTDMWTHSKTNDSCITVTAQFMDSVFTMQSVVLATRTVSEKHTSECIRECVKSILDEFGARRDDNEGCIS